MAIGRRSSRRFRRRQLGKVDTRAKAMTRDVASWLGGFGDELIRTAIEELKGKKPRIIKVWVPRGALTDRQKRLLGILERHGLRQMKDAGAELADGYEVPNRRVAAFMREKEILVVNLSEEIEAEFKKSMSRAIANWLTEKPTPSMGEIARRIRTNFFVKPEKEGREGLKPIKGGVGLVRTVHGRAELIARTELATARNTGHLQGMEAAGIKYKEWVAVTRDRKSGKRKHHEMDGVRVPVGSNFVLPDGTPMSAPGIGPIHQTANCRCTVVAAREP